MIIDIPTNHNFASVKFTLNRNIASSRSAFTNRQRTQEYDGVFWSAELTLPPMQRTDALEWITFLTRLQGTKNTFLLGDPSHTTNAGTYNADFLAIENRLGTATTLLNFSTTNNTISDNEQNDSFQGLATGDFVTISGASAAENNGTFKITTFVNDNIIRVDKDISNATEQSCSIKDNAKGITGLNLTRTGTASGTIKKGDYLALHDAASATSKPIQYVLAVEDATVTSNDYAVRIEPKLRVAATNTHFVKFANPKGQFRLASNQTSWSVNQATTYGIAFTAIEVING